MRFCCVSRKTERYLITITKTKYKKRFNSINDLLLVRATGIKFNDSTAIVRQADKRNTQLMYLRLYDPNKNLLDSCLTEGKKNHRFLFRR